MAGEDGTLRRHFRDPDTAGRIHAKTGSLDGVLSLVSAPRLAALTLLLAAAGLSAAFLAHPSFSLPFALAIALILLRHHRISHDDILGRMEVREEG